MKTASDPWHVPEPKWARQGPTRNVLLHVYNDDTDSDYYGDRDSEKGDADDDKTSDIGNHDNDSILAIMTTTVTVYRWQWDTGKSDKCDDGDDDNYDNWLWRW